ncbi:MAG TPA: TraX family protein [Ramlibacter sp.]|nr:TraX family protein [Ramlibacter sp.]
MADAAAPTNSAPLAGFTDGQLEALKWIALASMFLDHVGRLVLGYGQHTWVFALGRIAFPLFALVLALNLAREGDRAGRALRTARRLALWCAIAIVPSVLARGEPYLLNVLGTLALGAMLCWVFTADVRPNLRAGVFAFAAVGCWFVEFEVGGVFLVPAIFLWRTRGLREAGALAAVLLLLVGWLNGYFGGWPAFAGTMSAAAIALLVRQWPVRMPRLKAAFYVIYPLHLALIAAWKTWS